MDKQNQVELDVELDDFAVEEDLIEETGAGHWPDGMSTDRASALLRTILDGTRRPVRPVQRAVFG